jgi:hypothetical protein
MSTLNVANITDGTDTVETGYVVNGSAKAWVYYNQVTTLTNLASFNVSSLSDIGVGTTYTNLSAAMGSTSFSTPASSARISSWVSGGDNIQTLSSSQISGYHVENNTGADSRQSIAAFGDLA